jgi:hypothetical protein
VKAQTLYGGRAIQAKCMFLLNQAKTMNRLWSAIAFAANRYRDHPALEHLFDEAYKRF